MARMVVIYRTPKNVEAFDRHYFYPRRTSSRSAFRRFCGCLNFSAAR
jgi:hypothetical protein